MWNRRIPKRLTRPLLICNIETTGLDLKFDEIVIFSGKIIFPDCIKSFEFKCNTAVSIDPEATKIHGLKNEDLNYEKPFSHYASYLIEEYFPKEFDIAGYNILKFCLPILDKQLNSCGYWNTFSKCHIFDGLECFRKQVPRTLDGAYQYYAEKQDVKKVEDDEDTENNNENKIDRICIIIDKQLQREPKEKSFEEIADETSTPPDKRVGFTNHLVINDDGEAILNFGKHKGVPVKDVTRSYIEWMIRTDFPEIVKDKIREILYKN